MTVVISLGVLALVVCGVGFYFFRLRSVSRPSAKDSRTPEELFAHHRQTPHQHFLFPEDAVRTKVLENGMTLFVARQGLAPKVLVQIAYNVGSAHEQEGERGLAHLLEHMIFKGTDTELAEGDIDAIARKYGADMNAFTSHDMTSYYFDADKNNWEYFLPILADCMQNAKFDSEHLASEVHAVIQELRMNTDSYFHLMFEHACRTLFPAHHPYHAPIIGYKEDLAALSVDRLKAFYKKYYGPSRAVLAIVGDIDPDVALARATEIFSQLPAHEVAPFPQTPQSREILMQSEALFYRDIQQEYVGLYWEIPGMGTNMKLAATLDTLAFLLGAGMASRLQRILVDGEQIATNVQVYSEQFAHAGIFFIIFQPKRGMRELCSMKIREILSEMSQGGVSSADLYRVVKHKQRGHMEGLDDIQHFVSDWFEFYFATGDPAALYLFPNTYPHVTSLDIAAVVKRYLLPELMQTVVIAPLSDVQRALWSESQAREEAFYSSVMAQHVRTAPLEEPTKVHTLPAAAPLEFSFPQPTICPVGTEGFSFLWYPRPQTPLITFVLSFVESAYIARSAEGALVDMMMSLLLEGSTQFSKEEITTLFEQEGASYSFSDRGVTLTCSTESFPSMLAHLFHVFLSPHFEAASFEKVRELMMSAYMQKKESPRLIASQTLKQALYGSGHPYGWSYDSMGELLNRITLADIRETHARYTAPEHWVISIVGDGEREDIARVLATVIPPLRGIVVAAREYPAKHTAVGGDIVVPLLRDQLFVMYGQLSNVTLTDERYIPLQLLTTICFFSLGSRMLQLREETGLFYGADGAWASDVHTEQGFDYIATRINRENSAIVHEHIEAMLEEVMQYGVSEDELNAARQLYLKELIDCTESSRALAAVFANIATLGVGFDYYNKARARVESITVEEVNAVAREYLRERSFVRVLVGRLGRDEGRGDGKGNVGSIV